MTEQNTQPVVNNDDLIAIPKEWYLSKTVWLNVLTFAIAIITITDPSIIGLDPKTILWISSILNIGLRFITSGSVTIGTQTIAKNNQI